LPVPLLITCVTAGYHLYFAPFTKPAVQPTITVALALYWPSNGVWGLCTCFRCGDMYS